MNEILYIVKGTGGVWVKVLDFLVLTYVVALLIFFSKWAHFPLNSKRLERYGVSGMGRFHMFSAICMEKWFKKFVFRNPLSVFLNISGHF